MSENKIAMDTGVFTGIVDDIRGAASDCVLPQRSLNSISAWEGTDVGEDIMALIKDVHRTAELYRTEASVALPNAICTLRDSMIAVDKEVSESLTVERVPGGNRIEQKK